MRGGFLRQTRRREAALESEPMKLEKRGPEGRGFSVVPLRGA